jgi:hypothetical protein
MVKNYHIYKPLQISSSLFMLLALLWLTVSIPFVNAAQQALATEKTAHSSAAAADDATSDNPLSNDTEEKGSGNPGSSLSEEYLHHSDELLHEAELFFSHHIKHTVSEYVAFHGEMLCPPPNFLF